MIRVVYIPQVALPGHSLRYTWNGRLLTATLIRDERAVSEQFDLSVLQPGDIVEEVEPEILPINPVVAARCHEDGTLEVHLLLLYTEYEPPELEEVLDG